MKLKRYFPFIILILLSCILLAALPVSNFFGSEYPKDLSTKIQLSLRQGLGMAGVILLISWIGVGVNALIARVTDAKRRRMLSLGTALSSLFLCVALPILVLALIYGVFSVGEGWTQLPAPHETPKSIAAAGHYSVVIESEEGNYFSCSLSHLDLCWQPENKPESPVIQGADYGRATENTEGPRRRAPGNVINIKGVTYKEGPNTYDTHYVLLDDGTIWYLRHDANTAGFAVGFLGILFLPLLIAGLLFLIGFGLTSLLRWLAGRIWRVSPIISYSDESSPGWLLTGSL